MRSQNRLALVSFSLAVLLSQIGPMPAAVSIPNSIDNGGREQKSEPLPPAPSTPPPAGNRTPGGGLGPDEAVCPEKPQKLTAITPVNVYGKTLSERPTFWFYVPYTSAEVGSGQFSVLTEDDGERVYETAFTLPEQPGLVSITLPAESGVSLQEGGRYHWHLKLACVSASTAKTNLKIDGWVDRVAATPERQAQVTNTSPEIWYDAIDYLAAQLQSSNTAELGQTWTDLLKGVELCDLTEKPLVGPVMLVDSSDPG